MAEVIVVGAGLAGLTAAIHCARAGHEVRVLERYGHIGGMAEIHPSVDVTPMDPVRLGAWLGIELKPPYVTPPTVFRVWCYGRRHQWPAEWHHLQSVERGARSTSLESYLYGLAKESGVRFEFGWTLRSQADAAQLPPNTIIATGLMVEAFEALNLPYQPVYGFIANGRYEGPPVMVGWFDDYTGDYNYLANVNGVCFALAFDRRPVRRELLERWREQLSRDEGVELTNWKVHEGVVAVRSIRNPRLFAGNKILAGTLAGMQDPFCLFGVHSSLVSGKIAAIAVDDKAEAYELFRRVISTYKFSWVARRLFGLQPHWMRKVGVNLGLSLWERKPGLIRPMMEWCLKTVPGYGKI